MKLSHVIVAIVFFLLGAAGVYFGAHQTCQQVDLKAGQSGTSVGFAIGITQPAAKPPSPGISSAPTMSFRIEKDVNRHGSDYRDFAMAMTGGFEVCQKACAGDTACLAFTFVAAGVQAPHCWLKNRVPQAYPDITCVSGVKG